jgi:hypothetical protein
MVNFATFIAKTQNDRTNNINPRVNQKLEDRSYIQFEFPGGNVRRYRIPFFENPTIKEDNKARLVTYNPVSRAGSLFSYAGAESRTLKLDFTINMDHVKYFIPANLGRFALKEQKADKLQEQQRFFEKLINPIDQKGNIVAENNNNDKFGDLTGTKTVKTFTSNIEAFIKQYKLLIESELKDIQGEGQVVFEKNANNIKPLGDSYKKTIGTILFWLNLVRSSVLNNSQDPVYGPPIIRLFHGAMYQGIPCVCRDYVIDHENIGGMEERTLIPRILKVSMTLTEFRAGDFTSYEPGDIKGDNITGWESVIGQYGTLDSQPLS